MSNPTIIEIINSGTEYLKKHNVESPRLNVELLLCKTLNLQRLDLYLKHDMPLGSAELEQMRQLLRRRAKREPLQYLLGKQQFINIDILLDENVLIPRPETEILAKLAEELIQQNNYKKILDIGTGSGCIAIYLGKKFPDTEIIAIDANEKALAIAQKNAITNNVNNIKFYQSDILKQAPKQKYDLIVSNPPYISLEEYEKLEKELFFEPKEALTDNSDGLTFYRRFAEIFKHSINAGGMFLLELPINKEIELEIIFKNYEKRYYKDFNSYNRILLGKVTN